MAPTSSTPASNNRSRSATTKATTANASFGTNMPLMSSAFDTSMWLDAA